MIDFIHFAISTVLSALISGLVLFSVTLSGGLEGHGIWFWPLIIFSFHSFMLFMSGMIREERNRWSQ